MTQSSSKLTFYNAEICPFGMRAWIALELKKLDYEIVWFDLKNKSSEFTEIYSKALGNDPNSNGKVPIIKHNDNYLAESEIVCRYLDYIAPNQCPFFPKNPIEKAKVELMTENGNKIIEACYLLIYGKNRHKNVVNNVTLLKNTLKLLNDSLVEYSVNGPYLCDNQITLFEICVFPFIDRLPTFYEFYNCKINDLKWEQLLKGKERLKLWYNTLLQHPIIKNIYQIVQNRVNTSVKQFYINWYTKNGSKD